MKESSTPPSPTHLRKRDYFDDPHLPLQVYLRDPQPEFPLHGHGFNELVIILKGTALHLIDGQAFPVKSGDVFVISPQQLHQYQDMHHLALANVLYDPDELGMDQWDIRALPGFHALFALEPAFRNQHQFRSRLQLSERQLSRIRELIDQLHHETHTHPPGYRVMATGLFMQLAVSLSRLYSRQPGNESLDLLRIGDAIAHIETHYADPIRLEELAAKAHLSKRHFQRVFRQSMGKSPIDHLLHLRLHQAAKALRRSDRSITEIAYGCGFSDSNYFARRFREAFRQTPSQYRKSVG